MENGYYLFFSPEAGVVPHFAAQALIAKILQQKGHKVLFVRCHGLYSHCPVMDMYLLPHSDTRENQQKVCGSCVHASTTALGAYGLESVDLRDFLSVEIIERIQTAMADPPADLRDFRYDGIPFGTLTVIDLVLATKVSDFAGLSEEMREVWLKYLSGALLSYLLTQELIAKFPILGIVHHEDYGILLGARVAGSRHGIPSTHVGFSGQMGGDRRIVALMHMPGSGDDQKAMVKWPEWRDLSLPPERVREPMDDLLGRFGSVSSRVYSPKKSVEAKDLFTELGIPRGKKLLTAFTSSLDERLAVDSVVDALELRAVRVTQPWPNQIEWLKSLIDYVGRSADFHLVVRIHPREGANKRESKVSQHLGQLRKEFDRPLPNVTFVWPGMEVSSYDLAEIADLVLTAWTTLGLEVGRVGVPVLASTWALAPRPNDDFHVWAPTPAAYFSKLEEMSSLPPRLETVLHGFRWHYIQYYGHMVDFGDIIPTRDFHGLPQFFLPAASDDVVDVIVNRKDLLDKNRSRLAESMRPGSLAAERKEVRVQLRRALRFLFTGEENPADYRLLLAGTDAAPEEFLSASGLGKVPPGAVLVLVAGKRIHFVDSEKVRTRVSAMAVRLAILACDSAFQSPHPLPGEALSVAAPGDLAAGSVPTGGAARSAEEAFVRANRLKSSGDPVAALAAVEEALAGGLVSPELLNLQGHLECLAGNPQEGMALFQQVVSRWPGFAMAHNNLTVLHWQMGDRKRALEQLSQGLKADPFCKDLVGNAVRMFQALGEREQARAIGDFYLKKHPSEAAWIGSMLAGKD